MIESEEEKGKFNILQFLKISSKTINGNIKNKSWYNVIVAKKDTLQIFLFRGNKKHTTTYTNKQLPTRDTQNVEQNNYVQQCKP